MYSCVSEGPCASPSATLTRLWAAVDHAINDQLPWTAQIKVPAISDGAALRRHGPGVHSPIRQLSTDLPRSPDMRDRSETAAGIRDPPLRCAGRAKDGFKRGDWASA